ncbi:ArsJ-associated glyceraldehyde-3-phosphate dehydrogenase [Hydrogenovibrio sp. 3SP14C1]|uniref:ArsJ-associated glyceraldehyde-3-phosphate dehydrogenase n=1 Tax=Hydrogenovibrio sp. 3SP14C1 TaxID=3038774 RepID=UPI002416A09B|nr:ArsJ-associated glyceraldehyde-3-phosphate dehydrogenase [Hydrogenovibrio sp. 3SP14C1]MDG4812636.1 ArsJ-associated glyceraldehyde-3-phosphate dehydrogenase [Hydrogenovibrio sp. 3SP14C1]
MIKIAINGFGRMGRLALREAYDWPDVQFVHINETATDVVGSAHLLHFDSAHGRWWHEAEAEDGKIHIEDQVISYSSNEAIADTNWGALEVDIVIEATGKFRTQDSLQAYLDQGVKQVIVAAPMKEDIKNIVMGINDNVFDAGQDPIITAASCTTNCIAPVIKVMHEKIGIQHGMITTMHDRTNTQKVVDHGHSDLRRARASFESLIPTTTGSAKAIGTIFPELNGRLNGLAVRVPLMNASLTDLVLEMKRPTSVEEVNQFLKQASENELEGILGYEERPLVSVDYEGETCSSVIDAPSTMVVNGTQVKLLAWYDNEIGYVTRMMELAVKVALLNRHADAE